MGKVRFFFRASVSIGRRVSLRSACAGALCASGVLVLLLLNCADLLRSPLVFFCDVVFMVFFFCSAVRLLSIALHEKAEAPALPRGSNLQGAPRVGGLVCLAEAMRAMEKNAEAEKAGPENEAADTKNRFIIVRA